jgi:hypothetical protein
MINKYVKAKHKEYKEIENGKRKEDRKERMKESKSFYI